MLRRSFFQSFATIAISILLALPLFADAALDQTMDKLVTRLYATKSVEQLRQLTPEELDSIITPEERAVLAANYWTFDVNVPVVVSVMRHVKQAQAPFWLDERGFEKTQLRVTNEECEYEVWQRKFDAGSIGLGINGFDGHRFCYFLAVAPQRSTDKLEITNLDPASPPLLTMDVGAMTYIDWTELVLTTVPEELRGHVLLTTYRGRARESHLLGGFRETSHPSSETPDQITLTWSGDPMTSQAVLWRTNLASEHGALQFRPKSGTGEFKTVSASSEIIDDLMLANDRSSRRFTAVADGLEPGTTYVYRVGNPERDIWSAEYEFTTAPRSSDSFSFVLLSDTHNRDAAGQALAAAYARTPRPAFSVIAGDLVDSGLRRDDWDKFFAFMGEPLARWPVVPAIGNHDDQDGLGPGTYLKQFALPDPKFPGLPPERAYSLRYANALFLVIPIGISADTIAHWLERELSTTDATWKFAVYHFPIYTDIPEYQKEYTEQREKWCAIFDKYHLDFLLTGHTHRYFRSEPLRGGVPAASTSEGTIYVVSAPRIYQTFDISGNRCEYRSLDLSGNVKDELTIVK